MYPFERFTPGARKALTLAQEEATASGRSYLETGHLLLGLIRAEDGRTATVLRGLGLDVETVRSAMQRIEASEPAAGPRSPRSGSSIRQIVEAAFAEAHLQGTDLVGTEHLLLALTMSQGGGAARALAELGVTWEAVTAAVEHPRRTLEDQEPG